MLVLFRKIGSLYTLSFDESTLGSSDYTLCAILSRYIATMGCKIKILLPGSTCSISQLHSIRAGTIKPFSRGYRFCTMWNATLHLFDLHEIYALFIIMF